MKFTFAPGSTPLDGYTIRRAIHRGGFGEVYYATSAEGRETALKLLQNNLEVELRGVRQCLNLSHPNLVTIFDVKQDADGDYWIVMEYVPGDTLSDVLSKNPNGIGPEQADHWIQGITAAVTHLHSRGLVHRDLKPGNVFADGETVKVGDVGLSKFIAPSKQSAQTQSVGTVYYMAPEVAQGTYGPAVDQYALGIIGYELLTGRVPFDGESTGEILLKHLSGQPDLSLLPEAVRPVIARALSKSPEERFANVEEFASAFGDALRGVDVAFTPQSAPKSADSSRKPQATEPPPVPDSPVHGTPAPSPPVVDHEFWSAGRTGLVTASLMSAVVLLRFAPGGRMGMVELGAIGLIVAMLWNKPPEWAAALGRFVSEWTLPKVALFGVGCLILVGGLGVPASQGTIWFFVGVWLFVIFLAGRSFHSEARPNGAGRKRKASSWRRRSYQASIPAPRSGGERLVDWASSAALAPLAVTVLTAVTALVTPDTFYGRSASIDGVSSILVFGASALCGVWVLLGVGQGVTPDRRSVWHTRLVTGLCGVGIGAATWALATWMTAPLPQIADRSSIMFTSVGDHSLLDQRRPTLAAFSLFFGTLFFLRSWIRQTFPLREHRLRIGSVIMSVVVAWLASKIFAFPTSWAMLWAAVVSCGLQSVATWTPDPLRGNQQRGRVA